MNAPKAEAAEPLAPWFGGKKYLATRIIARIARIPHRCYAEPFVGMGGVFLRKPRARAEVVGDRSGAIVNLFRMVREHPGELGRQFDAAIASRADFRRLVVASPDSLTEIQRAARFAFLQALAFGGKLATAAGDFGGSSHGRRARFSAPRMQRLIRAAHRRLDGVAIECLDWADFLKRYDRPATLFYLDPPYWGHEADYGKGLFSRADFGRLKEHLKSLRGRFLMSLNDTPEMRRLFGGFDLEAIETRYSANARATRQVVELLIGN